VPAAPNAPQTTTFAPVEASALRLQITGAWDRGAVTSTPRNVQVTALEVRP
jgi:hypothetical protein